MREPHSLAAAIYTQRSRIFPKARFGYRALKFEAAGRTPFIFAAFPSLQVPSELEVSVAGVQGVVKVDASENGEDEGL